MTRNRFALAALLGTALSLATLRAQNQAYDQFAPKPVTPAKSPPPPSAEAADTSSGTPAEVLMPALRGIVFVSRAAEVDAKGGRTDAGIVLTPGLVVPAPDAFRALVSPYLGLALTRGRLNELINGIVVFYRKHDRPIVDVIVPEQDVNSGTLQILLLESRVGEVSVVGNKWFSSQGIRKDFRVQPGDEISALDMRADLDWANQNPFHTSDVVYQPGKDVGTTDVVLQTQDRFPARFYSGYEDSGNRETGFDRYLVGLNWGDAWDAGWDQQLNYQYTTSGDFRSLEAHSGSYVIPLKWHHTLTFFGNYVTTEGAVPPIIAVHGRTYQISGRYTVPLRPIGHYKHSVGVGFDYKYNKNSLEFGDIPLTAIPVEVRQFAATYDGSLRDAYGISSISLQGYWSPGNWGGDNNDVVFGDAHGLATSRYAYADATASRLVRLPHDWSLFLRGNVQLSDANLVPSEQLGLGGYDTVRGYDEREVNNDEGYVLNVELRTPSVSLGKRMGWTRFDDQLQFLAFWDYGVGYDHTLLPGEPADNDLAAVGLGLRYTISSHLSVRADYGIQLHKSVLDNDHGSRGDIGIVLSY
jgi:hemolysin activation/secretion protein